MIRPTNLKLFSPILILFLSTIGMGQLNYVHYNGNVKSVRFVGYTLTVTDSSNHSYDSTITAGWNSFTKYARNGNKLIHNQYDYENDQALLNYYVFTYNEQGLVVSRTEFDGDGKLFGEGETFYNENNQIDSSIWRARMNDVIKYYGFALNTIFHNAYIFEQSPCVWRKRYHCCNNSSSVR